MNKDTISSRKKRCSKFELPPRHVDPDFMEKLNVQKQRNEKVMKLLQEKVKATKLKEFKKDVKPFAPLVPAPNISHQQMRVFANSTITTEMNKFYAKIIVAKIQTRRNLEQKYPQIVQDIMKDAKVEFVEATHEAGVCSKVKPQDGTNCHIYLPPYRFPGRTSRRPVFLRNRERIRHNLFLPHYLMRMILKECIMTIPPKLIDFGQYRRSKPFDLKALTERFGDEMMVSRYLLRTFYKNIVKLVRGNYYSKIPHRKIEDYLRACTGLLSIHISRTVENTMLNLADASGDGERIPFLRFNIAVTNVNNRVTLSLDPPPEEVVKMFNKTLLAIADLPNNIPVLQAYKYLGFEDCFVPIYITADFVRMCEKKIKDNLTHMFHPLIQHIKEIEDAFYDVLNKYDMENRDVSFADGCSYIGFYRDYVHRVIGTVANEYFPIGKLEQTQALDHLKSTVNTILDTIFEKLCLQHQYINNDICEQFELLVVRATRKPQTTEELMELGEYMLWANTVLLNDLKLRITESLAMTTKLIEMGNLSAEHMALNSKTVNWIYDIKPVLEYNASMYEATKAEFEELLQKAIESVKQGTKDLEPYMVLLDDMDDADNVGEYLNMMNKFLSQIRHMDKTIAWINKEEASFKFQQSTYKELEALRNFLNPFYHLVNLCHYWNRVSSSWLDGSFDFLNFSDAETIVEDMLKSLTKIQKGYRNTCRQAIAENNPLRFRGSVDDPEFTNLPAPIKLCQKTLQSIKDFRPTLALMGVLCNDSLLQRHWDEMSDVAGEDLTPNAGSSLRKYREKNLIEEFDKYEVISTAAIKERQILNNLLKMQSEWAELKFKTNPYKETSLKVLTALDDIQAVLDDHIIKTLSMRGSVFVKPYEERVKDWYAKIQRINRSIDEWGKVQAQYLYLLPIFSSKDIVAQMPNEGNLFREVNSLYLKYIGVVDRDPRVIETAGAKGLMEAMIHCSEMLEKINEGVVKYLENKRLYFPRFFFLSNDEMLEILTETKNPLRVQPHLRKCFEAVNELRFDETLKIHGMLSQLKEYIPFLFIIDTEAARGSVEKWLVQVEENMVMAVREQIRISRDDYPTKDRNDWVQLWPGQVVLAVSQIYWTSDVHVALQTSPQALAKFADTLKVSLQEIVALIRDPRLTNLSRITIKALIVIDVHAKDVVEDLVVKKVQNDLEFKWLSQLRYYWEEECWVRLINATVKYAYEYLGNSDRLVITPLTDRCYRTLIGAYHLHLNGAPEGPAGTGKTETTKDLAKALAVQCVVFNCSDGLDYKAMGKFFKGLAASGAWACFDEFNRIEIEVLSVVAQQILCIVMAVRANAKKIVFEGTELPLNPACYVCITMNPGYAGRSELPDNLKVLFRTVAMMVPDYALIGEISLYSYGFIDARKLAVKIVTTYRLCSEQLSSQNHYDYGMRAVKSVLSACGNNKQKFPDENEDILLLRSLLDVNLPKFLNHDIPLFNGIISDLFPGTILPQPDYANFLDEANKAIKKRNLQPKESFLTKIIQTYEMMIVRHGFMMVGDPFSGKTSTLYVLADTLTALNERGFNEFKVQYQTMNPKSITGGQLYGQFDPVSYEWFDGVVATCFRNFVMDPCPDRKWIIFDGPVDAVWIENMNTVLDDNKKLCLMSGEVIAMTDVMSLIFEVMDLAQASPATVSRCGMIYMQAATLGWKPFVDSWLPNCNKTWSEDNFQYIMDLIDWLVPPCLTFIRKHTKQLCNTGEIRLVKNMYTIFEMVLDDALRGSVKKEEDARYMVNWIQATLVFAGVWGLGSILDTESRSKFDAYYRGLWLGTDEENPYPEEFEKLDIPMPVEGLLIDYTYFYRARGSWKYWPDTAKGMRVEEATNIQQVLVPTVESEKYMYIAEMHIRNRYPVLLVGPTGTGKSFYMQDLLMNRLDQDLYEPAFITFTVQISANQVQDLVISKLNKKRRGHYVPPKGKLSVIFIDDLNLPVKEIYGAQPPIELIRQYFDHGNWYDLKTTAPVYMHDVLFVSAMGVVGGSRQEIYPRFLRHFSIFSINEFDEKSMSKIYGNILLIGWKNNGFPSEVITSVNQIVGATLDIYSDAALNLRPTPAKSHYVFNLRDFSRIIFGCSMLRKESVTEDRNVFAKLWIHEILRVFYDRLVDDKDKNWVYEKVKQSCRNHFKEHFDKVFEDYASDGPNVTEEDLSKLMFGTYLDQDSSDDERRYEELVNRNAFIDLAKVSIDEFNATHKNKLQVVLFKYALEHLSKICRVLSMSCGSALLVGVSGSGRQSLTRLASTLNGYTLFQPEITKNYGMNEFRDDIKQMLKESGGRGRHSVFLFTEGQMKEEGFLQDIDCLLNSGEVPNIYEIDERQEIVEMVRLAAQGGNKKIDISTLKVFSFFTKRCREKLHIMLCFSPIGSAFRTRLRLYPSLINCCTIDWFESWPEEALEMVATYTMTDINVPDEVKSAAVIACKHFHVVARNLSEEFYRDTNRKTYITSASYLELIRSFTDLTTTKQIELTKARNRYLGGLSKLEFAAKQIAKMSEELGKLQPQLKVMSEKANQMAKEIAKDAAEAERASALVKKDEEAANAQAAEAQALKAECEAELALALPVLEEALSALDTLKPADITMVKSMKNPPAVIKIVMAAVCVIYDIKPDRVKDPSTGKMGWDYWGPSKRFLGDLNFLQKLKEFDKDNIRPDIMAKIRKEYIPDKQFQPSLVAKASSAAEGLCKWIIAMDMYDKVAKVVAPKKAKLAEAEASFNATMKILTEKKAQVETLEAKLAVLNENLRNAQSKQKQLTDDVDLCSNKLRRAEQLIGGLGGEKTRWTQSANDLLAQFECLAGDMLVCCGIISYLSPFTSSYRNRSVAEWHKVVKELNIPTSTKFDFIKVLGTEVKIQNWYINALPNDAFSTENAVIIDWSRRYSLLIDPQNQANIWIKKLEKANNLECTKFSKSDYMKTLEHCIENGLPCLLESVEEDLEAPLDPILFKITFRQAGMEVIALGDNVIPFNKNFRFYLTSNLRNPHYLPEVFNKVTIINFALTVEGLQDQLLGIVVARERPDLQTMKEDIIRENANNKAALVQVEENILKTLAESEGDILEDEKAIQVLDKSKTISEGIKADQAIAVQTEMTIEASRQVYSSVAQDSAVLYYCISDLPNIDPMYQFSLAWFINLYVNSIEGSVKSREIEKRLQSLKDTFTYNLYSNVCRSLFEKDKLMFSFVLCSKIKLAKKHLTEAEFLFLLTGGVNVENPIPNPCPDWLADKNWNEICRVEHIPAFAGFRLEFERNWKKWQAIYDADDPQDRPLPEPWDKSLTSFQKLIGLRLIRADKLTVAITKYIQTEMGEEFIKPPPFNIAKSYGESSALCPLVFILSAGTDPMSALVNFAESKNMALSSISLGQGQGPLAQDMIRKAQDAGTWVCLQNCHLAVSWMPSLENLWENMDTNNTHGHFRLWLTSYPSDKFPVSILKYGVKMTNEPPTGLQQNLYKSYINEPVKNPDFFKGCAKEKMFARLLFGIAFFHAVIQERRTFGPLGWNIAYGFNDSDFDISIHQLQMFINENEDPYEAISYLVGECNYGGRVTDDWDRRLIMAILADFLNPEVVSNMNYRFAPIGKCYGLPVKQEYEDYIAHINEMPQIHPPEVFGLHANAGMTRNYKESQELLNSMIKVQGESQSSATGESDKLLVMVATDILSKLPKKFDVELAQLKYPFEYSESMNTVLVQEMERFNKLLGVISSSLQNVRKAVDGLIVMTPALELLSSSLLLGRIPEAWAKVSYPSLKSLPNYVADFVERIKFLDKWYLNGKPPTFWLSGFFFTQAFLTGGKQNFARKYTIPIDQLTFDYEVLKTDTKEHPPEDGIYVYGMFTDGARWDRKKCVIEEQLPKVLYDYMPLIWLIPITTAEYNERGRYKAPLYKTSERKGILSTTGHSTNYVLPFLLETELPPAHWIKRSMALLCQLD